MGEGWRLRYFARDTVFFAVGRLRERDRWRASAPLFEGASEGVISMPRSGKNSSMLGEAGEEVAVFVGHARLPQTLSSAGTSGVVLVEVEVALRTGMVVGVTVSGFATRAEALLSRIMVGKSLKEGVEWVLREFQHRYVGAPQKAVCTAVASAYDAYQRHVRQEGSQLPRRSSWGAAV